MWLIFYLSSICVFFLSLIFSVVISRNKFVKKHKISFFHSFLAGVFIASFLMFVPVQFSTVEISFPGCWGAFLLTLFNSVKIFASGCEFNVIKDAMQFCPDCLKIYYQSWAATLYVIAPVFTFSFVLSLFKNISAYFKYFCSYSKDAYIFSELNEKSLALASDIKKNNNNAVVVFTDVFLENKESLYELTEKAINLGAICFKKDILLVDFSRHSVNRSVSFFTIGYNETENLNQTLKLIENYKNRKNTHIYVFSTKTGSELLLTAVDKGFVRVRRINEVQSLVNRVLYEKGNVLFESAGDISDGKKKISAVVVGMGNHGTEMVKGLSWFGQMNGYELEINAFDKDPLAAEKFIALAPELMSPDYNGVNVEGEAKYKINVHPGIDIESTEFIEEILRIRDTSYVFIALGNDDININTAINLRMYFERISIHPVIQAIVYNPQQKKALEGIKNYRGQEYNIEFIGDIESSFTEAVIIDSELEDAALKLHMKWGKEEEFWTYEYNYRSSVASAIHMKARKQCGIPGSSKKEEELTDEERTIIEVLEHRRWNAYMRSEGYVYSGSKDKSSRNDLAKMHHDLVDYSSLSDEEKRKDSKIGTD